MIPKGRIQLAITQNLDKAMAKYPWANHFITRKCGIYCFESRRDFDACQPGESPLRPRPSKRGKRESL